MTRPLPFDPERHAVGLGRDYEARTIDVQPDPQIPVEGATFGVASMSRNAPHGGERHLDGDEVLYVVSGRIRVVFIDGWTNQTLFRGTGLGVWS